MATEFPGQAPTTTTVESSPSPTTTVFTVADATDLIEGQWINVQVSSSLERAKISSISSNEITLTSALSGVPDTPGEVRSTRTLIKTSTMQGAGVFNADDVADLKGEDFTYAPAGLKHFVPELGIYQYDPNSSDTGDDELVIDPTTGPGRTLLVIPAIEYVKHLAGGQVEKVTQASHGFSAQDVVRYSSGSWAKAQANSIAGCSSTWLVSEVIDTNTFVAHKTGKVTITSHGLTVGSTYYLSATTAGALTATRPIGSNSAPLGYYLPVVYVRDANTLEIVNPGAPLFNPVYARYKPGSTSAADFNFTGLDLNNVGRRVKIVGAISGDGSGATSVAFTYNSLTTGYAGIYMYPTSTTAWSGDIINTTRIVAAYESFNNDALHFSGDLMGSGPDWGYVGGSAGEYPRGVFCRATGPTADITSLQFNITNLEFDGSDDYVDLIISQMPDA